MSSPRVLMVSGDFPPLVSGVGDYVDKLAAALIEAGAEVSVLTSASADARDADRKFTVLRTIDRWSVGGREAIVDACRGGYDLVHFQYPGVRYGRGPLINLLPTILRWGGGRAVTVLTVHDFRVMRRRWRARMAPMLWAVNGLIHVDERDWPWIRAWGVGDAKPRAHIPIAPNARPIAVDDRSRRQWRADLGMTDQDIVVAFFGILYPHKGLDELVGAVDDLRRQGRPVRLLVLGDFDREATWRAEIERLLDRPSVRWVRGAPLEEVSRGLHAADLAALPFHSGASTNRGSLLSALAHGLPTVTTRGPHTPPDFDRAFDVLLVPVQDRSALAAALARLIDEPTLAHRMRQSALARGFTWQAIARQTLAFYDVLLAARGRRVA